MHRFSLSSTWILFLLFCGCSSTYQSQWQGLDYLPDGSMEDWPYTIRFDRESNFYYSISNDENNLYIGLKVREPRVQTKILVNGLWLYVDPEGKSKENYGIQFPMGDGEPPAADIAYANLSLIQLVDLQKRALATQQAQELIGLNGPGTTRVQMRQLADGVKTSIGFDQDASMIYEAVIPFDSYFKLGIGKKISVRLTTGSFSRPKDLKGIGIRETRSEKLRVNALAELTTPSELLIKDVILSR